MISLSTDTVRNPYAAKSKHLLNYRWGIHELQDITILSRGAIYMQWCQMYMPKPSLLEKARSKTRKRAISQSSERKWTKTQPSIVELRITEWMVGFYKRPKNKNNNLIEQMVDGSQLE